MGFSTTYSKGGCCHFNTTDQDIKVKPHNQRMSDILMTNEGWVGWFGLGGSFLQWNPEEKISFGYVPFDFIVADGINTSGESIKKVVMQCVKGTY